jgi:hypothetical protein
VRAVDGSLAGQRGRRRVHVHRQVGGANGTQAGLELDGTNATFNIANLTVTNNATGVLLNNAGTVNFRPAGMITITSTVIMIGGARRPPHVRRMTVRCGLSSVLRAGRGGAGAGEQLEPAQLDGGQRQAPVGVVVAAAR